MTSSDDRANAHLTVGQVTAYLDRTLPAAERRELDAHLAACPTCRREVIEVDRTLPRTPPWRRWTVIAPLAAAAAALAVMVVARAPEPASDAIRNGVPSAEGVLRFAMVSPPDAATVPHDAVRFTWRGAGAEGTYRLQVTTPDGAEVWTLTTADTTAAVPGTATLEAGRAYFWSVDALLPDGRTATTGWREFRTGP